MITKDIALFALSSKGTDLGRKIQLALIQFERNASSCLYSNFGGDAPLADPTYEIATAFSSGRSIIGVCASGILIRAIATSLGNKRTDPPILAISEDGSSIVPLLGGHHGANRLAIHLADALNGKAALTTASECHETIAPDDTPSGWRTDSHSDFKPANAALLLGTAPEIKVVDSRLARPDWFPISEKQIHLDPQEKDTSLPKIAVSLTRHSIYPTLYPRQITVGMGCERGARASAAVELLTSCLEQAGGALEAIAAIGTLDLKGDEPALHAAADIANSPLRLFTASALEQESDRITSPSEEVWQTVGTHSVAEAAALALAGDRGELLLTKTSANGVTCALALAPHPLGKTHLAGRPVGSLAVVGLGPGTPDWRCPEAVSAMRRADLIVGFTGYLELAGDVIKDKPQSGFPLGQEVDRVRVALTEAASGKHVALICSGDPGVYAMASLVFEEIESASDPIWSRTPIHVCPGISAMQAASARVGAPLGHDFCALSLSDLLTPWDTIAQRIKSAAEGDFVIAFYNPVSMRRKKQLAYARDVLLSHRPPETPVIIARQLGRPEEAITVTTLKALEVDMVDMLSVVIVGSSQTRTLTGAGQSRVWTPRGYEILPRTDTTQKTKDT